MKTGIEGGLIVAFDGQEHRLLRDGIVVFENDKVVHVGKSYPGQLDRKIDAKKRLVIPGFIDLHSHIAGCPFERGYRGDRSTRTLWNSDLYDRAPGFWASQTQADNRVAMEYSLAEMLKGGITTVVELGAVNSVGAKGAVDLAGKAGIRAYLLRGHQSGSWYSPDGHKVLYENFDGEKWDEEKGLKQLDESMRFIKEYNGSHDGRVRSFLYPEKVDTCSPSLFKETRRLANEHNLLMQSHVSQSGVDFREIMRRHGKTPIEFLADLMILGSDFIAAHSIVVSGHSKSGYADPWDKDIQILAKTGTTVAHCPRPFSRYGIAMESYAKYLKMGVNVGLGTDTFPQDMLREMQLASTLSKVVEGEPSIATSKDVLDSATLSGAKALKRPDLGRIAVGAKADLTLIRLDCFNMCPITDPIYLLVQVATNSDVDMVIVDGRTVVEEGKVIGYDEEKVFEELQESMNKVLEKVPEKDRRHRTAGEINPSSLKMWQ